MKKIFTTVLLTIALTLLSFLYPLKSMAYDNIKKPEKQISESIAPLSKEQVLQAYIGLITSNYTTKPLTEHYGMKVHYQLEDVKVIYAKMLYGNNKVDFIFKIQVQPFVGAHDPLGTDEFTFRISDSDIILLKYEHTESFPIPPYVKSQYKNLKPNY
jgi:hypothetical protein